MTRCCWLNASETMARLMLNVMLQSRGAVSHMCRESIHAPCSTQHCSHSCWKRSQRRITGANGTVRSWVRAAHCRMPVTPQLPAIRAVSSQETAWLPSPSTPGLPHACKHANLRPVILLNRAVSHHVNASCTAHHQH